MKHKLDRLLNQINKEISKEYSSGTLDWIRNCSADMNKQLKELETYVNKTYLEAADEPSKVKDFVDAVNNYRKFHINASNEFKRICGEKRELS